MRNRLAPRLPAIFGPIQTIIPWASTFYTEAAGGPGALGVRADFWGFWMLGGMSGEAWDLFSLKKNAAGAERLGAIMRDTKRDLEHALPFAMEPVVYDFAVNEHGTFAELLRGDEALLPRGYYGLMVPPLLRQELRALSPLRRAELDRFAAACRAKPELSGMVETLFDRLPRSEGALPAGRRSKSCWRKMGLIARNALKSGQPEEWSGSASRRIDCRRARTFRTCCLRT